MDAKRFLILHTEGVVLKLFICMLPEWQTLIKYTRLKRMEK